MVSQVQKGADFDDEDMVDSRNGHYSANPPMTDDDSDEDSEIDLENPYEQNIVAVIFMHLSLSRHSKTNTTR